MQIILTWQAIITLASVLGAIITIVTYFAKVIRFIDHQREQDAEIQFLKNEQGLQLRGILAALKGLKEQGCDGPVTDMIAEIEQFLTDAISRVNKGV